jgi:hypothetical protein
MKLCECGCGEPTNPAPFTAPSKGWIKGEPVRFRRGHSGKVETVRGDLKRCGGCFEWKPLEEFHKSRNSKAGRDHRCKPCNRRRMHERSLLKLYGLTWEKWTELVEAQGGRCAICGQAPVGATVLDVDHCHDSQRIRGLLCRPCNVLLGHAKDDPACLRRAAEYLERGVPLT